MHDHAHIGHSHGPHDHGHGHSHGLSGPLSLVLGLALLANLLLVIVEFVAGYMGHSIALVSDGVPICAKP